MQGTACRTTPIFIVSANRQSAKCSLKGMKPSRTRCSCAVTQIPTLWLQVENEDGHPRGSASEPACGADALSHTSRLTEEEGSEPWRRIHSSSDRAMGGTVLLIQDVFASGRSWR